jgi:recombinational DNA repair protein RecR
MLPQCANCPHPAHARYDFGSKCLTPRSAYLCEVCGLQVRSQMGVHIVYASGFLRIEELEKCEIVSHLLGQEVSNIGNLKEQPHAPLDHREQGHGPEGDDANDVQR